MAHAPAPFFGPRPLGPWGPGEGPKGQISLNLKIYNISDEIFIRPPGSCPGVGLGGTVGGLGVKFFL